MSYILPFIFEERPIRGKLICLTSVFKEVVGSKKYPKSAKRNLAELLIFSAYLGSSLKSDGSISIQFQSEGLLKMAFVECRSNLELRGIVKPDESVPLDSDDEVFQEDDVSRAKLAITIFRENVDQAYQSLVPVESADFKSIFRDYINQSEQIETVLEILVSDEEIYGLFLQKMPGENNALLDDNGVPFELADIVLQAEYWDVKNLSPEELLQQLFSAHLLRVFDKSEVVMKCNCKREKVEKLILVLGEDDANKLLEEQGTIRVDCEMCGKVEEFDKIDIATIFNDKRKIESSLSKKH